MVIFLHVMQFPKKSLDYISVLFKFDNLRGRVELVARFLFTFGPAKFGTKVSL